MFSLVAATRTDFEISMTAITTTRLDMIALLSCLCHAETMSISPERVTAGLQGDHIGTLVL